MSILDLRAKFCNEQVVCNDGAEASDNWINWGTEVTPSPTHNVILRLIVTTAFTGLDSGMRVTLQDDTVSDFNSTLKEQSSSPVLKPAQLTLGAIIDIPLTNLKVQSYARLMFTPISENASAGAITAGLV